MGLDMYLYLRKHESIGRWDESFEQKKEGFYPEELKAFEDEIAEHNFLSKTTTCQVGYWRKENAIHNWFVHNCGDDVDECQTIYVSLEKAKELLQLCKDVLADHSKAEELLHTQSGFFFGSTEYDDWYFEGLKYTADLLEKVINFVESQEKDFRVYWDIIYEASW